MLTTEIQFDLFPDIVVAVVTGSVVDEAAAERVAEIKGALAVMEYSDAPTDWSRRARLTAELAKLEA